MRYIAMTIGPIYRTISMGRRTAEIWGASYLFSYIMRQIVAELKEKKSTTFIVPNVDNPDLFTPGQGVGYFHDRFILKSGTLDLNAVHKVADAVIVETASKIAEELERQKHEVIAYFKNYFTISMVMEDEKKVGHPILYFTTPLDQLELNQAVDSRPDEGYMRKFLQRETVKNSFLFTDAFGESFRFDCIAAIAAGDLAGSELCRNHVSDEEQYKRLKDTDPERFKQCYKYICIVQADGDKVGRYLKGIAPDKLSDFSQALFGFNQRAKELIEEHNAVPIFIGGDDLLFFAPVFNGSQTIFELLEQLNTAYEAALGTDQSGLSFGLSITYYKYPLYDALQNATSLLFDKAKDKTKMKRVAVALRKHSGQSHEALFELGSESFEQFASLMLKELGNHPLKLPHNLRYKLDSIVMETPLRQAKARGTIEHFFKNVFNESVHEEEFKDGLKEVVTLLESCEIHDVLRMLDIIKFLRGDR